MSVEKSLYNIPHNRRIYLPLLTSGQPQVFSIQANASSAVMLRLDEEG